MSGVAAVGAILGGLALLVVLADKVSWEISKKSISRKRKESRQAGSEDHRNDPPQQRPGTAAYSPAGHIERELVGNR